MSSSDDRVAYIKTHFMLKQVGPDMWEAIWDHPPGKSVIIGATKERVCREARAWWGHFNFDDEAIAFAEIFPTTGA